MTNSGDEISCPACKVYTPPTSGYKRKAAEMEAEERDAKGWIGCEGPCEKWHHCYCVGVEDPAVLDKWYCPTCIAANPALVITHKPPPSVPRKSSRSKRAIDYAALNDGDTVMAVSPLCMTPRHVERLPDLELAPNTFPHMKGEDVNMDWVRRDPTALTQPIIVDEPAGLEMTMPSTDITVDDVARLVGPYRPVEVIDCVPQELSKRGWTMQEWADHYARREGAPESDRTLNVISLEVSGTKLAEQIVPPKLVRELDWVNLAWPENKRDKAPKVQLYCLMSTAGSFTDWHIDFAASSVYYHVLRGLKVFYLARPTTANLAAYEKWNNMENQTTVWFGDMVDEVYKVELQAGNTLLIPSGWMHAVHTPTESLVFGGNFLHSFGIPTQLELVGIEYRTHVPSKFKFPQFQRLLWYVAWYYNEGLKKDNAPLEDRLLRGLYKLAQYLVERVRRIERAKHAQRRIGEAHETSKAYKLKPDISEADRRLVSSADAVKKNIPSDKIRDAPALARELRWRIRVRLEVDSDWNGDDAPPPPGEKNKSGGVGSTKTPAACAPSRNGSTSSKPSTPVASSATLPALPLETPTGSTASLAKFRNFTPRPSSSSAAPPAAAPAPRPTPPPSSETQPSQPQPSVFNHSGASTTGIPHVSVQADRATGAVSPNGGGGEAAVGEFDSRVAAPATHSNGASAIAGAVKAEDQSGMVEGVSGMLGTMPGTGGTAVCS